MGNQVLRRDTAVQTSSIRSTLLQETVRRLLKNSVDTEVGKVRRILSQIALKLVDSGHSQLNTKIFIVQGVTKYLHRVEQSRLPKDHNEENRQVDKYLAKMGWFRGNDDNVSVPEMEEWRRKL